MTLQAFHESDYALAYEQTDQRIFRGQVLRDTSTIVKLCNRSRADVVALKPLRETQYITRFLQELPDLRVIWLVRDFRSAAASAAAKWTSIHQSFRNYLAGAGGSDWRFGSLTPDQHQVICRYYAPELSAISVYALFWYVRSSYYFAHDLAADNRVRLFFYEDLVASPSAEYRTLMEFCGCRFDPKCCRHVVRPLSHRASDATIEDGISALCENLLGEFISLREGNRVIM